MQRLRGSRAAWPHGDQQVARALLLPSGLDQRVSCRPRCPSSGVCEPSTSAISGKSFGGRPLAQEVLSETGALVCSVTHGTAGGNHEAIPEALKTRHGSGPLCLEEPLMTHLNHPTHRMAIVAFAMILSCCATLKNTPQQEYVYAMSRPCEGNGATIAAVAPDGKTWRGHWTGGAYTWPEFQQCVQEQMTRRPYTQWLKENGR